MEKNKKMGALALSLMVFTSVYGFANMPLAYFNMGYAAIPYFLLSALVYFLPFSLMVAEMAQTFKDESGGIYTWMEKTVNIKWAFTGIFMWWISYVVWMMGKALNMWIPLSYGIFGKNVFTDENVLAWTNGALKSSQLFGIIGVIFMVIATTIAIKGIKGISKIASVGGIAVISLNVLLFISGIIVLMTNGLSLGQSTVDFVHSPNPNFVGTLGSLGFLVYSLFAYGGMEASGGLVDNVKDKKSYINGLLISAGIISIGYALGVFFVGTFTNWQEVLGVTDANGNTIVNYGTVTYVVVGHLGLKLGEIFGMSNPEILQTLLSRFAGIGMFLSYVGAFFTLVYAPLRQMIDGTPNELWPGKMGEDDPKTETPKYALIGQAVVVIIMVIAISFGGEGATKFFSIIQGMTNIAMTLPYIFISVAYYFWLTNDKFEKPLQILSKNIGFAKIVTIIVILVVAFGNIFSVLDVNGIDEGIKLGTTTLINIPGIMDIFVLGPIIFTVVAYLIVHHYEKRKK
jgi:amino acid transporter